MTATQIKLPRTTDELREWAAREFRMSRYDRDELVCGIESVLQWQRDLLEHSKADAIRAMSQGFAERLQTLHAELSEKDHRVSAISRYFEDVVADLSDKSQRDPKTRLYRFDAFHQRFESYLATEQRVQCIGVGVVDINSFKIYNDTLGHAVGDRIIERVACLLAEKVRSEDLIASDHAGASRDLHARLGGDEFCFVITDLQRPDTACLIGNRYKRAVEGYDWSREHEQLAERPVKVDVGIVCLELGAIDQRRGHGPELASALLDQADQLMYSAKQVSAPSVYIRSMRVDQGQLVALTDERPCGELRRIDEAAARIA
ncbi:MAG TPA: GGDEF domain-containing protein [Vicinamibacterales bacterium]|nr:GGDEF domain-containing protein [Vicinamibacterales bacterium]